MSLSANIKRSRLEEGMTQEQLATRLGVSAQAVSKWETSETYPDGAMLVPLANELGVSLDELFDNEAVSMADISVKIRHLLRNTAAGERFEVVRDICWQIERGLFNCRMEMGKKYDPNEIKTQKRSSYILDGTGFTMVSNGDEPFFAVFPQPPEGYGHFLKNREELREVFEALSHTDTMDAVVYLYRHTTKNYVFEPAVLGRELGISEDRLEGLLDELLLLGVIAVREVTINGRPRRLCYSRPSHGLLALFLVAHELGYRGSYCLQADNRIEAFFK